MDRIMIEGLEVFANHGVFPEENILGQKFVVSAVLYTETRKAGKTDRLEESIHYGEAAHRIKDLLEHNTFQLIERAAEVVCERLLMEYPLLQEITLKLEKPWAPIGLPLKNVAVEIHRKWHKVFLSMGSNMGDKEHFLSMAVEELKKSSEIRNLKVSDLIVTEPYGYTDQDEFLNGCMYFETLKSPYELLDFIHQIEKMAGRERKIHWGPRTLDLDILFYDDLVMGEEELTIPHKEVEKRIFVLEPLVQIAPNFRHPVFGQTMEQLLDNLTKK